MDTSPESITCDQFLGQVQAEYAAWKTLVDSIAPSQRSKPLEAGGWSVIQHISHITWYESEMVHLIESRSLNVGSPLWDLRLDDRNRAIHEENRNRRAEDLLRESEETHTRLISLLETLTDQDLIDPAQFVDMPADWQPWVIIASNTYEHYRDHLNDVLAHLKH